MSYLLALFLNNQVVKYSIFFKSSINCILIYNFFCLMKLWFVWETNAWKSTLFNKFFWSFRAIVADIAWTTRENISEKIEWSDEWYVEIYDSPWISRFQDEFEYIKRIIDLSDIIVLVVDWKWWLNDNINIIVDYIRKSGKEEKTVLAVNKIDTTAPSKIDLALAEFYWLWFKNIIAISAKNNFNLVELKENIENIRQKFKIQLTWKDNSNIISFTLVGRINVGKSTLFNSIIWKDWSRVSSQWWTTLDYLTYKINYQGTEYEIIDTAWFRRKWKIHWLEKIAVKDKLDGMLKYKKAILVIMFDISEWITHRDMTLLWEMIKKDLPIIVAFNKIDSINEKMIKIYRKELKTWMRFAPWIPIVMVSWKEKKWFNQLFKMLEIVNKSKNIKISQNNLYNLIQKSFIIKPPKFTKNKAVKIKYLLQDQDNKNEFIIFVNKKENINFAFKKWLENIIREEYWFIGVPLIFHFKESKKWEEHTKRHQIWKIENDF